ncbi:MAG: hypothetical protein DBX47_07275 [Clostridiales bacterium]|nr:MAG: hypothetical protein DBX47_07275 [Clostridiales bacterium]
MTKKRKIIISVATAVAVATVSALILFAMLYVSEHFDYKAGTNTFVFNSSSSYKTNVTIPAGGNITVQVSNMNTANNDKNSRYSLIIVPSSSSGLTSISCDSGTRYSYGVSGYSKYPSGAIIYEGFDIRTQPSVTLLNSATEPFLSAVYVVRDTDYDYYIGSYFDLQMSQQEYFHNFSSENIAQDGQISGNTQINNNIWPFIESGDYANVYIISSFEIPESFTYNVPCFVNLLDFNITLSGGGFTIKHGYSGLFSIATLTGQIINTTYNFNIFTPNAYYKTEGVSGFSDILIVSNTANFTKTSENINLDTNPTIKSAVIADARLYIELYLKHISFAGASDIYYVAESILLPENYYNYGLRYTYTSSNSGIKEGGHVTRSVNNITGGFTVNVYYKNDIAASSSYTQNMCVVGTDGAIVRESYFDALGVYVNKHQPSGASLTNITDLFSNGVDIKEFTDFFAVSTDVNGQSALNNLIIGFAQNQLHFEVISGSNVSSDLNSVKLIYTQSSVGIEGFTGVQSIIIKHNYYISTTSDIVKGTFEGVDLTKTFPISFIGVSLDERNKFLERTMPEIYIGEKSTTFKVLNRQNTGMYIGDTQTGTKVNPTNLSMTSLNYSMYYLNESAVNAVVAINKSNLTRVQKSEALEALFSNNLSNTYLNTIITQNSITSPFCATSYSGKPLLGDNTAYFSFDGNGIITMNTKSFLVYNGVLVLVGRASYQDGESGYVYHIAKTLYSPASGLGGGSLNYTESGMFADIFSSENNWIGMGTVTIQSTDSARYIKNLTYTVTTLSGGTQSTCNYFSITETAAASHIYSMTVTKENIPRENTTVNVSVVITDGTTDITEKYSFIIPGVYLYNNDIDNIWVYLRMIQVYGETDGYLLVDNAQAATTSFDCSFSTLNKSVTSPKGYAVNINYLVTKGIISSVPTAPQTSDVFSLGGIQYLIKTDSMIFDNIKISSLLPFSQFSQNTLTTLSLSNCAITNEKLCNGYPIYSLNKLRTVNLSYNTGITNLAKTSPSDTKYILYRTVTTLNVDDCAITSLSGLENLVKLNLLEFRRNAVKDFGTLTKINTLSKVYLGSNLAAGGYYGTHGSINMCNIVNLIHKNVEVYTINSGSDKRVLLYEKKGTSFYLKGQYIPTTEITSYAATNYNILQNEGYLITLEQEYLGVTVMSFFNFKEYCADVSNINDYSQAISVMFPSTINEYSTGGTSFYTVAAVDLNPASTSHTRTYRISIKFNTSSANTYRFGTSDYYPSTNGGEPAGGYMEVFREITFDVYLV